MDGSYCREASCGNCKNPSSIGLNWGGFTGPQQSPREDASKNESFVVTVDFVVRIIGIKNVVATRLLGLEQYRKDHSLTMWTR